MSSELPVAHTRPGMPMPRGKATLQLLRQLSASERTLGASAPVAHAPRLAQRHQGRVQQQIRALAAANGEAWDGRVTHQRSHTRENAKLLRRTRSLGRPRQQAAKSVVREGRGEGRSAVDRLWPAAWHRVKQRRSATLPMSRRSEDGQARRCSQGWECAVRHSRASNACVCHPQHTCAKGMACPHCSAVNARTRRRRDSRPVDSEDAGGSLRSLPPDAEFAGCISLTGCISTHCGSNARPH